jgi:hypothetical protein
LRAPGAIASPQPPDNEEQKKQDDSGAPDPEKGLGPDEKYFGTISGAHT